MTKTVILQEQALGKDHSVTLPCVIGREAEAGLSLPDPTVSHRHALVEERDGRIWIQDRSQRVRGDVVSEWRGRSLKI